jgi:hypothetical protein
MKGFENTGNYAASELEAVPELISPAAGLASACDSRQQVPRSGGRNMTPEHTRTGLSPETLKAAFQDNLNSVIGRPLDLAAPEQRYEALAQTVRDRIMPFLSFGEPLHSVPSHRARIGTRTADERASVSVSLP